MGGSAKQERPGPKARAAQPYTTRKKPGRVGNRCLRAAGPRSFGPPQSHVAPHLPEAAFAQDLVEDEVLNVAPGAALPDLAIGTVVWDIISRDSWLFFEILVDPKRLCRFCL